MTNTEAAEKNCTICMDKINDICNLKPRFPCKCKVVFHQLCWQDFLRYNPLPTCPWCRQPGISCNHTASWFVFVYSVWNWMWFCFAVHLLCMNSVFLSTIIVDVWLITRDNAVCMYVHCSHILEIIMLCMISLQWCCCLVLFVGKSFYMFHYHGTILPYHEFYRWPTCVGVAVLNLFHIYTPLFYSVYVGIVTELLNVSMIVMFLHRNLAQTGIRLEN